MVRPSIKGLSPDDGGKSKSGNGINAPDPFVQEFRAALAIDKNALDDEVERQPDLYFQVSQEYAYALSLRDEAKDTLAQQDATLGMQFRQQDSKANESKIKDMVAKDPLHAMAYNDYMKKKRRTDVLVGLQEAFHQRRYVLGNLCGLYQSGYFSSTIKGRSEQDLTAGHAAAARAAMSRTRRD